jgi:hypothetical protein
MILINNVRSRLFLSDSEEQIVVYAFVVSFMYFRSNACKSMYVNVSIFFDGRRAEVTL